MRAFYEENKALINKLLVLAAGMAVTYVFFAYVFTYVAPFVAGFIISLALNPLVNLLQKRLKVHRGVSALVILVLCIVLLFGAGSMLVGRVVREAEGFASSLPLYIEEVQRVFESLRDGLYDFMALFPLDIDDYLGTIFEDAITGLGTMLQSGVQAGSVGIVTKVPPFVTGFILAIISAYFFIKDRELISITLSGMMPSWLTSGLGTVRKGVVRAIGGYVRAQLIVMCVVASICILGLTIIGNPYSMFIGLGIALIDMLPVFGSGFIFWPWIAYSLLLGDYAQAVSLGIIYVIAFLSRQALEPRVVAHQIGIHPLITLVSIYAGLMLFGMAGLLLGPVICVVVKAYWQSDRDGVKTVAETGEGPV